MINGTLIIQIINFWIGYLILKEVFLKKALSIVESRDEEREKIETETLLVSQEIEKRSLFKDKNWSECLEQLKKNRPVLEKRFKRKLKISYQVEPLELEESKKSEFINSAKEIILEKISKNESEKI